MLKKIKKFTPSQEMANILKRTTPTQEVEVSCTLIKIDLLALKFVFITDKDGIRPREQEL
jgi:hypothetical protein